MRTFLLLPLLAGCPRDRSPEALVDPAASFHAGVELLQSPGRDGVPDYEAAYFHFVEAERGGAGPRASYDAGWAAERLGRREDALSHYRRAADQAPDYVGAVQALVPMLIEQAPDEAVARTRELVRHRPEMGPELVSVLIGTGRYDEALGEARAWLRQHPDHAGIYQELSRLYAAQGQPALAELCAERALALDPRSAGTLNDLGVLALDRGDTAEAVARFRAALAVTPDALAPNANLGLLALQAADYARAVERLLLATQADPSSIELGYALGLALRGQGDLPAALQQFEQIPAHPQAASRITEIQAELARRPEPAPNGREQKRQEALLSQAAQTLERTRTELATRQACLQPETSERISLVLDQIAEVVASGDLQLADELVSMLDQTAAELGAAITEQCP